MYTIQKAADNKKYIVVGEYTLWLYEDNIEAMHGDQLLQIHDYILISPTKTEKLEILTDVIQIYHNKIGQDIESCSFDI